jgi:hypothetical protein
MTIEDLITRTTSNQGSDFAAKLQASINENGVKNVDDAVALKNSMLAELNTERAESLAHNVQYRGKAPIKPLMKRILEREEGDKALSRL